MRIYGARKTTSSESKSIVTHRCPQKATGETCFFGAGKKNKIQHVVGKLNSDHL